MLTKNCTIHFPPIVELEFWKWKVFKATLKLFGEGETTSKAYCNYTCVFCPFTAKITFIIIIKAQNSSRVSSIIQCCIYPGQWFDQWICVRKKNKYSTKYWVPQSMIDVFVPEVEISPQVRKEYSTKYRIVWRIVTKNPLLELLSFFLLRAIKVQVVLFLQNSNWMYPIRKIQIP